MAGSKERVKCRKLFIRFGKSLSIYIKEIEMHKSRNGLKFIGLLCVDRKTSKLSPSLLTFVYGDNQSRSIGPHNSNEELKWTQHSCSISWSFKTRKHSKRRKLLIWKKIIFFLWCMNVSVFDGWENGKWDFTEKNAEKSERHGTFWLKNCSCCVLKDNLNTLFYVG